MSFGKWYEEQKQNENGDGTSNSSLWMDPSALSQSMMNMSSEDVLPLFNTEGLQNFSFENMKQTMEAQMPKKILGMGYQQRFQVFCALLFLSVLFFALAFFVGMPMIVLKPQKFALSFTCGSITFMGSFGILKGPMEHLKGLFAADRLYFTFIYFGSMFMTLYLTFTTRGLQGYALVMAASGLQLVALLWYLISFLPGGAMGLNIVMRAICTMLQPIFGACLRLQAMCISTCFRFMNRS